MPGRAVQVDPKTQGPLGQPNNKRTKERGEDDRPPFVMENENNKQGARNPKQPKGKKDAKRKRPQQSYKQPKLVCKLSPCCHQYALALSDPWDVKAPVGLPGEIPLPTYKFACRARGTFIIGNAGNGFIAINPMGLLNSNVAISTTIRPILTTTTDYMGSGYTPYSSLTGLSTGVVGSYFDSPFNIDSYALTTPPLGITTRIVGGGVKVRYVGSELNRAGRIFAYRNPVNVPMVMPSTPPVTLTESQLTANKECSTQPVNREWHAALYKPATSKDLSFSQRDDVRNVDGREVAYEFVQSPTLLCYVSGSTAGNAFEYDVMIWAEAVGTNLSMLTPTFSDPSGKAAVLSAVSSTQPTTNVANYSRDMFTRIADHITNLSGMALEHYQQNAPTYKAIALTGLRTAVPHLGL